MVMGVGTDILAIERIRNSLDGGVDTFIGRVFTEEERREAAERQDPVAYYALRFAAKEAVFKCFGIDGNNIRLNEIEILGTELEQPRVALHGKFAEIAAQKGIRDIQLSLSYETEYAVAFAVAQD